MLTLLQLLRSACVFTLLKIKVFNGSLQHLLTKGSSFQALWGSEVYVIFEYIYGSLEDGKVMLDCKY